MGRLDVLKTYKIFIEGKFLRTESGRYFHIKNQKGDLLANICLSSRKDFRNAVFAARNAQQSWFDLTALNRGQILYRIAEMLESSKHQFIDELMLTGNSSFHARKEVNQSIDRLIYYAGWSDKFTQIFSSVNSVSSDHFNFSTLQPMGVVSLIAPNESPLLGLVSMIAPVIVGGNTSVVLSSEINPMISISFAEVLNNSDLPDGVINILTGERGELIENFATHMDVNAVIYCGDDKRIIRKIEELSAENLKRSEVFIQKDWKNESNQSPYFIERFQEIKTTWHPKEA